jgi:hypothetical protein
VALLRRPNFSARPNNIPALPILFLVQGKKKSRLMTRRGDKTVVLLLIFPKLMMLELELAPDIETKVQSVAVVSSGQSLDHSS